jgi:hypothetical protein
MNNELERIWNEEVIAKCEVLSQNLPAGTEKNNDKPSSG